MRLVEEDGRWESTPVSPELRRALVRIAREPRLLVASDYDGTLAPIVADPGAARVAPESARAMRALAELPDTTTAVISSRALRELAMLSRLPAEVHLVGSHGSEFDFGFVHDLDEDVRRLHRRLVSALDLLVAGIPDVQLEVKPVSIAVHLRQARPQVAERVLETVREGPGTWDGVTVTEGNAVIELAVMATDKGHALDLLRHRAGATAAVFIGDGVADEQAFTRLAGPDVGIRVGAGQTAAEFRVTDLDSVAAVLALLAEERRAWLHGESAVPIERLSMLSNGNSVALVTPEATVSWMCHPHPDSAAIFAELVGGPGGGGFSIRPARTGLPLGQHYVPDTMTVQTQWSQLQVTDYLAHGTPNLRTDLVRVISGSTRALVTFAPRPEFGQVAVTLVREPDGLRVVGTGDPIVLVSPGVSWDIVVDGLHETAQAIIDVTPEHPVTLVLRCGSADLTPDHQAETAGRDRAETDWSEWLAGLALPSVATGLVARSALTLRGLCHADTGGILAAATTSLPEEIGGVRNWDYRYCWVRDGAMTAAALVGMGSLAEADRYLHWLRRVLAGLPGPEYLHPLYTLSGSTLGPEAVIDTLPGYAGSRPVRVGNLANQQVQLDVFGPVVELVTAVAAARGSLTDADWRLVEAMVQAVAGRWTEPDHGIWEEREMPRQHVHSKVMCWVTVDRALKLAKEFGLPARPAWVELRDEIATEVLSRGWHPDACGGIGAFTTAYDGLDLDAATLHIGLSGLVSPSDPRFVATVTAIEARLRSGATVYRYLRDDGLPGTEGGFHLCTAWLIEAYLLTGQRAKATELFKQLVAKAGPTGLLPEEYDPVAERSLGNHPQAYSHLGLIRCAQLLDAPMPSPRQPVFPCVTPASLPLPGE